MNLPWSNWTSRDVFPTPLSPTRMVCKRPTKWHQHIGTERVTALGTAHGRGAGSGEEEMGRGFGGCRGCSGGGREQPGPGSTVEPPAAPPSSRLSPQAAPRPDGSSRCAPSFAVPFSPTAHLGRDPRHSEGLQCTMPRADLGALYMGEEISVCTALPRKEESGRAGRGPEWFNKESVSPGCCTQQPLCVVKAQSLSGAALSSRCINAVPPQRSHWQRCI